MSVDLAEAIERGVNELGQLLGVFLLFIPLAALTVWTWLVAAHAQRNLAIFRKWRGSRR